MSDTTISVLVIAFTGAFVLVLFGAIGKRSRRKQNTLLEHCRNMGYRYHLEKAPKSTTITVEGDAFSLISTKKALRNEAQSGSSDIQKSTVYTTRTANPRRPSFVLGSVGISGDWSRMPDWMKDAALQKLAVETGVDMPSVSPQVIQKNGGNALLLFEQVQGESREIVDSVVYALQSWPQQTGFILACDPSFVEIRLNDCYVEEAGLLDALLSIGSACGYYPVPVSEV